MKQEIDEEALDFVQDVTGALGLKDLTQAVFDEELKEHIKESVAKGSKNNFRLAAQKHFEDYLEANV